ncbi:hypothetical protein HMPREF9319_0653 [Streptococcus equinus ATCC 700338]|uniref:Uncharacterized protein n=1 Tax=Streptococcus equinus ATCC 700338 TaxID=864569 RepID=E0PCT0_STREI|nr:hypothetical protein HMPREF9319_0653 [Streptococcus equinus ATCC 700338]KXI11817.1 hypothetical protein HMPREF3205_01599 [Streptococcus pasteurianus]
MLKAFRSQNTFDRQASLSLSTVILSGLFSKANLYLLYRQL